MNSDQTKMSKPESVEKLEPLTWTPEKRFQTHPTDMTLVIDQHVFRVHKEILKASSDYFQAMFSSGMQENEKDSITLRLVPFEPFQTILLGFYSGTLELNKKNVFEITEAAHILQLTTVLFSQCTNFLKNMINTESCFEVMFFCDSINLLEVYTDARRFCLANFGQLRHLHSFLKLTQLQLFDYLSDRYLVVDEEIDVFEAIKKWVMKSKASNQNLSVNLMRKLIASSICLKNSEKDLEGVMSLILDESRHFTHEEVLEVLGKRERHEDVFMFWSLLNTTTADGLVDIVKLCQDGQGVKVGTMTDVVERPGYDLGSAFCVHGCCVYLSGGGPSFGKVNWIRKLYKYDLSKILSQLEPIGDLYETRRHHAMIAVGSKLYIFGGFGKFRTKNLKLDCFDTLSGVWEALPATPSHEIKPVATTDQRSIFYMDRTHNVHCFDITSCHWSSFSTPAPARSSLPVAIFAVKQEPGSLMAVLDSANVFTLVSLQVERDVNKQKCKFQGSCEIMKNGKYEGCVMANGKLLFFVGNSDIDCANGDFSDFDPIRQIVTYCIRTKTVVKTAETNVKKALGVMAVPYLPPSFTTGSCRLDISEDI